MVDSSMILTPSAKDYASRNGISLKYPQRDGTDSQDSAMDRAIRDAVVSEFGHADSTVIEAVRNGLSGELPGSSSNSHEVLSAVRSGGPTNRVVLSAVGRNQSGILSRLTDTISGLGCDIQNVSQTIVSGYFTMILIVEIDSFEAKGKAFGEFRDAVMKETQALGLQAMVMHEDVLKAMHRV